MTWPLPTPMVFFQMPGCENLGQTDRDASPAENITPPADRRRAMRRSFDWMKCMTNTSS